ncbi:hypothetical protein STRCI_000044 [Streptomyces cinnabarinus]|uniref:Uncharacterized protein n=1 Tax=Streptomyces cinnabarinus TaxID=67287 RepID=A0ABY7K5Z3_9ACTN|nr:hypothetical protein [Streptomyces cinnabarinus]WAZ19025.1 hypothetical protein STRCI_000044 [Streptomyces cinnabarinus]
MHNIFPPPPAENRTDMGWPEAVVNVVTVGTFTAMIFAGLLPADATAFLLAISLRRSV